MLLSEIEPCLTGSEQLIVVTSRNWNSPLADIQLFERAGNSGEWKAINNPLEVVAGKNGLAWGNSLMPVPANISELKKEGDLKTPAGLFGFCFAFGYAPEKPEKMTIPYLPITENFVGVDDPGSRYYNCILDKTVLKDHDWKSAENMYREDGLYKWGLLIDYNFENQIKGAGSQIFMHIWRGPGQGTEGCIAMPEDKIFEILNWLDGGKRPLIWIR